MDLQALNFRPQRGKAIGAQRGLADALEFLCAVMKGIEGGGSVRISKVGQDWRIVNTPNSESGSGSGGIPDGYEERAVTLYCQGEKLAATILVKTSGLTSTAYGSGDVGEVLKVKSVSGESGTVYELQLGSGIPDGYTEREDAVVDGQVTGDPKKVQLKRGTALVKDEDAAWTDFLVPTAFSD